MYLLQCSCTVNVDNCMTVCLFYSSAVAFFMKMSTVCHCYFCDVVVVILMKTLYSQSGTFPKCDFFAFSVSIILCFIALAFDFQNLSSDCEMESLDTEKYIHKKIKSNILIYDIV